jgi:hypothetical protein
MKYRLEDTADCVGPGWRPVVQGLIDEAKRRGLTILQIKEKFGGLRFYWAGEDDEFDQIVDAAERACDGICEACGAPGKLRTVGYWMKTECETCHEARKASKPGP